VSSTAVVNWELPEGHRGAKKPTMTNLLAIAEITGVSFEWLATGRGEMAADLRVGEAAPPPIYNDDLLPLSADERQLLRRFRALPDKKRKAVIELLRE